MHTRYGIAVVLVASLSAATAVQAATPLGTGFTYQGQLKQNGSPVNGTVVMHFSLWDSASGGAPLLGKVVGPMPVQVTNGLFTAQLDFGNDAFNGEARWLLIQICPDVNCVTPTPLNPRQAITATPYALSVANGVLTSAGDKVGIGTNAPVARLHVSAPGASAGNNTAVFEAPAIGPNASNIHFGATGDWYIRSASGSGKVVLQDTGGFVGIGTANPAFPLTVQTLFPAYGLAHTDGTHTITSYVDGGGGWLGTKSNHPLHLFSNDSFPRVTVSTSGDVGVGTTVPVSKLDVRGYLTLDAGGNAALMTGTGAGELNRYLALFNSAQFTSASGLKAGGVLVSDDYSFASPGKSDLIVRGNAAFGTANTSVARLSAIGNTIHGVYGKTYSTASTAAGIYGEWGGGNSWAGYFAGHVNVEQNLAVGATGNFGGDVIVSGTIYTNDCVGCSDRRFKENIASLAGALAKVSMLRGVQFDWKHKEYPDRRFSRARQVGFVAQEVEKVLPEVVTKRKDGFYGVDYGRLAPVLVEAIKELKGQVDQNHRQMAEKDRRITAQAEQIQRQQNQIDSLQSRIKSFDVMEKRLANLEARLSQPEKEQVAFR